MNPMWWLLDAEIAAWRRNGARPRFWWRDDDAVGDAPALRRLLDLGRRHAVPLVLAVIPHPANASLARLLAGRPGVAVAQHGVGHRNARAAGEPPCEFRRDLGAAAIAARIRAASRRLDALPNRVPLYVPPWNRLDAALLHALSSARLAVSARPGDAAGLPGPARRDVHLDLLRWRPRPRFRGETRCLWTLLRLLHRRRAEGAWDDPIGLLSHHLDHDEAAWAFCDRLLTRLADCAWLDGPALLAPPSFALPAPSRAPEALAAT